MIRYLKFFVNGGVLGLLSWVLQAFIYRMLGGNSPAEYALATALAYVPLVILNYAVQKTWIFGRQGLFVRFVISNLFIMVLVSLLSPACRALIAALWTPVWGDRFGYAMAAIIGSVPSYLIQKYFVFTRSPTPAASSQKD